MYDGWGAERYAEGKLPTRYGFSGQYTQAAEFGWLWFRARWYDPGLGRWAQPDTLVPDPYNPQDWDRYAYVRNNPVRYTDPTGHDVDCGLQERCRLSTVNEFTRVINQTYKINISKSASFNLQEMKTIYNAIGTMEAGINTLTDGSGLSWLKNNFGGTTIARTPTSLVENIIFKGSSHVGGSTIYLAEDLANKGWMSLDGTAGSMIIHEFGHVLDNRSKAGLGDASIFGGGAGDQLMKFINAKPRFGIRATGGITFGANPFPDYSVQYPKEGTSSYGNKSTADYFANTFAAATAGYKDAPQPAVMWMAAYIDLTK